LINSETKQQAIEQHSETTNNHNASSLRLFGNSKHPS